MPEAGVGGIVVPASRPDRALPAIGTLARDLDSELVVIAGREANPVRIARELRGVEGLRSTVVWLPDGRRLLNFPEFETDAHEFAAEHASDIPTSATS
jgi:hypothetical protein